MSLGLVPPSQSGPALSANQRAARSAGLRYVRDEQVCGIRRRRSGRGFVYIDRKGRRVRDPAILARIRALVIPPAWTEVWICADPLGHVQAIGRDARRRKQYRYHPRWREARDRAKYGKLLDFAGVLPKLRRRVKRDLSPPGLPRDKVLAAVVGVMQRTLIRVGNDEYAAQNGSYGLTTLRDEHARVNGQKVRFEFRGKSGIEHEIDLDDPKLAAVIRRCRDLPGQELFQYVDDDGRICDVSSADVNDYLRRVTGGDYTTKDFRTWAATVLAAKELLRQGDFRSRTQANRNVVRAIDQVAARLGNTRAVCRKSYIHPVVPEAYLGRQITPAALGTGRGTCDSGAGLRAIEALVLSLLRGTPHGTPRRRAAA